MSRVLYTLSRLLVLIIIILNIINSIQNGFTWKDVSFIFSSLIFIFISYLYERRRSIYTVGFLFYFLVLYLAHLFGPFKYLNDTFIQSLKETIPNDHYWIYWTVFNVISFVILLYLIFRRGTPNIHNILDDIRDKMRKKNTQLLISMCVFFPVWYVAKGNEIINFLMVFYTTYFMSSYLYALPDRRNTLMKIGLFTSFLVFILVFNRRFIFVKYLFPILLAVIIKFSLNKSANTSRYILLISLGAIIILFYGVVSEIYKLSHLVEGRTLHVELLNAFMSWDTIEYWVNRQLYRVITIWTVLGGNIIDYVHENGLFYGLTFIKPLSGILGFEYVSLPVISAQIIGASYAQPGVVAEGYANWGIIGAVVNCLIIFFIAELLWDFFLRTKSFIVLLLYTVAFSQVILDGGTVNSIGFMIVISLISYYCFDFLQAYKK